MRDISFSEQMARRDDDVDAVIERLEAALRAAQTRECKMRGTIQALADDGEITAKSKAHLEAALVGAGACPHEAAACREREALEEIADGLREINPNNYNDDDVRDLNERSVQGIIQARATLASTAPCPHEKELAEARRLCGGVLEEIGEAIADDSNADEFDGKVYTQFGPELVARLRAFEKGGK